MSDLHVRSEASTSSTPEVSETVYSDVNNASLANLQITGRTLGLTRQQYDFYIAMPGSAAPQGLLRLRVSYTSCCARSFQTEASLNCPRPVLQYNGLQSCLEPKYDNATMPSSARDNDFPFLLHKLDPKRLGVVRFLLFCWLY